MESCECRGIVLLHVREVMSKLSLGKSKVYEMIRAGELPSTHIGTAVRVPCAALLEWVKAKTQKAREV